VNFPIIIQAFLIQFIPATEYKIGGNLNATFSVDINAFPGQYPLQYGLPTAAQLAAQQSLTIKTPITFRHCVAGEIYDLHSVTRSTCTLCLNSYSLLENYDNSVHACQPCPAGAQSCQGNSISLYPGTWRWAADSVTIFKCPSQTGCPGGNSTGQVRMLSIVSVDACLQ
jgi:hypothetical protein